MYMSPLESAIPILPDDAGRFVKPEPSPWNEPENDPENAELLLPKFNIAILYKYLFIQHLNLLLSFHLKDLLKHILHFPNWATCF